MTWTTGDTWIVVIGALAAVACTLPGTFLLLRRMSMMGDAISHAVLPGLAGAFLVTVWAQTAVAAPGADPPGWLEAIVMIDARSGPVMFVGAAIVGVLTALFTQALHRYGQVEQSAAMGAVFTTLFALGLLMMVRAADTVDLDPGCVLYGAIELAPLDPVTLLGVTAPRPAFVLAGVALVNTLLVVVFFKELTITSFDPALATTQGFRAGAMHYLLMTVVAVTSVAAFEAVGSILVVAMLIVPAATAHLLTDRLVTMLAVGALVGAAGAALGHVGAITVPSWFGAVDTSTAGSMAVATGLLFALAMLFAPRHGVLNRVAHRMALGLSIVNEDALGLLYRLEEHGVHDAPAGFRTRLRDALGVRRLTARLATIVLERRRCIARTGNGFALTDRGRHIARTIVRSHRLWEAYLVRELGLRPDHVHPTAMRLEHVTGDEMQRMLERAAAHPETDPHGREIPGGTESGEQ